MINRSSAAALLTSMTLASPAFAESGLASVYGNGDGHAGTQTKVRVRRSEDHGHNEAEYDRTDGELPHLHVRRHEGAETWIAHMGRGEKTILVY